ncbi:MAG TPA: BatA and WFA domain-containing protein [Gemmataceae bacterium]|nr:BatA and WFA domain-containing protein [Gemmataceae bacterium]
MNLANPMGLIWASLAIPIVIFYILKIRLRRVPVSTVLFWRQIFEEKKPRSLWQRLRHLLSLLVQLALLALLVGALVQPFFSWEIDAARRVVLVIDNSASMKAADVEPSRLVRAKELGQRVIDGLRSRDEMAIIAAGTQPQVICGLTGHQRTLHEHLEAVPASDGPTRLAESVALARRLINDDNGEQKHVQIIVLTDGCAKNIEDIARKEHVRVVGVGQRTGNVAITAFQARRSLLDPIGYEILAEVVNHSDEEVECRFEISLNGDLVDVAPLKLAANEKWSKVLEKTSAGGGLLTARIDREDALAADNQAVALLPHREFQPVTLVSATGDLFIEKVLEAHALVQLSVVRKPPAKVPAGAVMVYHHQIPNPLPPGNALVIDPDVGCDLWEVGEKLQSPLVTKQDRDSPLMAHIRLDNVLMPEARKLTFTPAAGKPQILAAALTGEPLLVALDRPEGKVLILTVNLEKGDLPLRTAFPILVTNTLGWFAGGRGELREALAAGSITEVALPQTTETQYLLRGPDGQTRKLPPGVTRTTVGPLDQCGVWSIVADTPGAAPVQEIASNLASREESDLRPPESLPSLGEEPARALGFTGRPIWFYLLAAAWLLAGLEWYLYQRRWIS